MNPPTISVVLPTYRRPDLLRLCLDSLLQQSLPAIEIIVGRRQDDAESEKVMKEFCGRSPDVIREVIIGDRGNLVASLNAALEKSSGELVALTDDDAEFPENWLERISSFFYEPSVGGVGGKDLQAANLGEADTVGRLQWFGRIIGNHHLAVGPVRDVEVLKGVNCCFRGDVLREIGFDRRLRGRGNVSNWELGVCFAFARKRYRLVFDPSLQVVHHVGPRHDGDTNNRGSFNGPAHADAVFNETLLLMEYLPWPQKISFSIWSFLIGTGNAPGLIQLPRSMVKQPQPILGLKRFMYSQQGRLQVIGPFLRGCVSS